MPIGRNCTESSLFPMVPSLRKSSCLALGSFHPILVAIGIFGLRRCLQELGCNVLSYVAQRLSVNVTYKIDLCLDMQVFSLDRLFPIECQTQKSA